MSKPVPDYLIAEVRGRLPKGLTKELDARLREIAEYLIDLEQKYALVVHGADFAEKVRARNRAARHVRNMLGLDGNLAPIERKD